MPFVISPAHRVYVGFATYSFAMCNIFPRLADVQTDMGVNTAALGPGLIGAPVGTLVSLGLATKTLERIGFERVLPLAMSAAAQRQDRSSALNIAALAQFSFLPFLLGPPLLGFVAAHFGIRFAFDLSLLFIALSLATAGALGSRRRRT